MHPWQSTNVSASAKGIACRGTFQTALVKSCGANLKCKPTDVCTLGAEWKRWEFNSHPLTYDAVRHRQFDLFEFMCGTGKFADTGTAMVQSVSHVRHAFQTVNLYTREPLSDLMEVMVKPSFFLKAAENVPCTECACQPVASQI